MPRLSLGQSVLAIAAATVVVGLAEVWLRPSAPFLVTPLAGVGAGARLRVPRLPPRRGRPAPPRGGACSGRPPSSLATIEALALAIDARDRSSRSQLQREQRHAAALARAFGMSEEEVECVRTAALLHDIGKLAVPDHILAKPGPLDG